MLQVLDLGPFNAYKQTLQALERLSRGARLQQSQLASLREAAESVKNLVALVSQDSPAGSQSPQGMKTYVSDKYSCLGSIDIQHSCGTEPHAAMTDAQLSAMAARAEEFKQHRHLQIQYLVRLLQHIRTACGKT